MSSPQRTETDYDLLYQKRFFFSSHGEDEYTTKLKQWRVSLLNGFRNNDPHIKDHLDCLIALQNHYGQHNDFDFSFFDPKESHLKQLFHLLPLYPNVHILNVPRNKIHTPDLIHSFTKNITSLSHLLCLSLASNQLTEHSLTHLAPALQHTPYLRSLHLFRNHIGNSSAMKQLTECLKQVRFLQELNIADNQMDEEGFKELIVSLKHVPQLTNLILSENTMTTQSATHLVSALMYTPLLERLEVSHLSKDAGKELATSFKCIPRLQFLQITHSAFSTESLKSFRQNFRFLTTFHAIQFRFNSFDIPQDFSILVNALNYTPTLRFVDLVGNQLNAAQIDTLCKEFASSLSNIHYLHLALNSFGLEGCKSLARELKRLTHLKVLDLSDNALGGVGAFPILSETLQELPSLTKLMLVGNPFDSRDKAAILDNKKLIAHLTELVYE